MKKLITVIILGWILNPGYARYVPSPCQYNACNVVTIELIKEFYDNLDDSTREYVNFDLNPQQLKKIAHDEKVALASSAIDMTKVVKYNIDQKKLAQINNNILKLFKDYYKVHDLNKNYIITLQFNVKATNKETVIEPYFLYVQEQTANGLMPGRTVEINQAFLNLTRNIKNPVITNSNEPIDIRTENYYITNDFKYVENTN